MYAAGGRSARQFAKPKLPPPKTTDEWTVLKCPPLSFSVTPPDVFRKKLPMAVEPLLASSKYSPFCPQDAFVATHAFALRLFEGPCQ
jgi:hypothetical protein